MPEKYDIYNSRELLIDVPITMGFGVGLSGIVLGLGGAGIQLAADHGVESAKSVFGMSGHDISHVGSEMIAGSVVALAVLWFIGNFVLGSRAELRERYN